MDNQLDSENYWNRSTSKAFCFDDDADEIAEGATSGAPPDGMGGGGIYCNKWDTLSGILNDDPISEASFDNSVAAGALNLSIKTVISEEALKLIIQEQTLDDRLVAKGVSPEEELKMLRRQIQSTLYSPSPKATAHKLLLGKQCSLEVFKSLQEKQQLLDAVCDNGGGDAIITVLLHMQRTLNRAQFERVLQRHPKALQHYVSFLTQLEDAQLFEWLQTLGKPHEAAMHKFKLLHRSDKTLPQRVKLLQELCAQYRDGKTPPIVVYEQIFQSTFKLLQLVASERNALDNMVDATSTPIEALHACCCKHNNWKEQDLQRTTSPYRLCVEQQISPSQFEWTALHERAHAQAYADLDVIFERAHSWHPLRTKQFHISFGVEAAIVRLHQLQAPTSVLYLLLSKMNNPSEKLPLAQQVNCIKAAIDALVGLKDIAQLSQLLETLAPRCEEQIYGERALKALQSKRWPTDGIKLKL